MMDSKVISILKEMREKERELICADIDTDTKIRFTHGDKAEALNVAIYELEHKDKFYVDKEVIREKIKEYKEIPSFGIFQSKEPIIRVLKELLGE